MVRETDSEFSSRRSAEEKILAANAEDSSQVIPHRKLAELHEKKALENASPARVENKTMPVAAADGHVEITSLAGEVTALTPGAASATADGLMARAHEAKRQQNASALPGTLDKPVTD